jgi:hypothetical protein
MMKRIDNRILFAAFAALLLLPLGGCGKAGVVLYEGKATFQGEPVPEGVMLYFRPTAGGRESVARVREDGAFQTIYSPTADGVFAGELAVYSHWESSDPPPKGSAEFLKKYTEDNALKITVKRSDKKAKLEFP